MSNRPVTSIRARKRGTTRFLTGSTPSTCNASSSSRILRAPRSAVIAVPATPASTIASTNGANSRIDASTKKPPRRSSAPKRTRKFAACRPGAPYPNATVETSNGNQHSFNAKRNWLTNSPPYGYGGRRADMIVLPVKIIMSPTSSSMFFAGRKARSATVRTNASPLVVALASHGRRRRRLFHRPYEAQTRTVAGTCAHASGPVVASRAVTRGVLLCAVLLAFAGCGGGRQDGDEPKGEFTLSVVNASFPAEQTAAQHATMRLRVRNTDDR